MGIYCFSIIEHLWSVLTGLNKGAFVGCSSLKSVTIPDSVTSIGREAFYNCGNLTEIYINDIVSWCKIKGLGNLWGMASNNQVLYLNNELITNLVIPDSVTSIGDYAFFWCSGLTSVVIPDSVTSMRDGVFRGCSGLTSVTIPDSVTYIGMYAFSGCSWLTSITIPDSVISVDERAFKDCGGLTNVTIGNGVISIANAAFVDCTGLTSVTIGNGVTSIGDYAFSGCDNLTEIHIKDIASWCKIKGLPNLMMYKTNKELYLNNELITNLVIPDSLKAIDSYAFHNCSGLTSVTVPDSVTSIGAGVFGGCSGLTGVYYTGTIDQWTAINFTSCDSNPLYCAKKLYIDNELVTEVRLTYATKIGNYAFYSCRDITSITISDNVTSIGKYAFYGCSGLTSITISDSVTSIGSYAFYNCIWLTRIFYKGTAEQWGEINVATDGNYYLTNAKRYYYSEAKPTEAGNYWHYDTDGVTPVIW